MHKKDADSKTQWFRVSPDGAEIEFITNRRSFARAPITRDDLGRYRCIASNTYGSRSRDVLLSKSPTSDLIDFLIYGFVDKKIDPNDFTSARKHNQQYMNELTRLTNYRKIYNNNSNNKKNNKSLHAASASHHHRRPLKSNRMKTKQTNKLYANQIEIAYLKETYLDDEDSSSSFFKLIISCSKKSKKYINFFRLKSLKINLEFDF